MPGVVGLVPYVQKCQCNYTSHKGYVSHVYPMIVSDHIHLYLPIQMAFVFY